MQVGHIIGKIQPQLLLVLLLMLLNMAHHVATEQTTGDEALNHSACKQKLSPGLCRGKFLRYAYNDKTGNCVSFLYTGCASTANNFLTFEECRRDCMQKIRY